MYLFVQLLTSPFVRFPKRTLKFSAFSTSVSKVQTSLDLSAVQGKDGMFETLRAFLGAVGPSLSFRFPMTSEIGAEKPERVDNENEKQMDYGSHVVTHCHKCETKCGSCATAVAFLKCGAQMRRPHFSNASTLSVPNMRGLADNL